MSDDEYKIYALRYAHHDRPAYANFLAGDPHDDENMPLDYFIWAVVGKNKTFIVDTGFDAKMAKKRGRVITKLPEEGLKTIGIRPDKVEDVIITHMHYDHSGNHELFPNARYHLQEKEMHYCTGRCMCHKAMTMPFEPDDVVAMVRKVFAGRVQFHDGDSEVAPGLSLHWVGGHTGGLQIVRVKTRRGWVVLASDASHLYANMEQSRPFPIVQDVGQMLAGYARAYSLADSRKHVVPGHDPDVLLRYPTEKKGLKNWVVRLDADPSR